MFANNSVPSSITYDLPQTEKLRARQKPRNSSSRGTKPKLTHRPLKKLLRWWPLFLLAVVLLFFKATSIGLDSGPPVNTLAKNSHSKSNRSRVYRNLNRLDPMTQMVAGVQQRCLELLPDEDLEHLDIPKDKTLTGPVTGVVYISKNNLSYTEKSISLSQEQMEAARFNSFTGYQTLDQREKSFQVSKTAAVHCGFYSENGGYKISDEDKNYLKNCKVAVSTCAFGAGDDLHQPIGISQASLEKVCYVAFWDEITLAAQEEEGRKIGEEGYIGKWRIVIVKNLPFRDQRLNGKIPKMLSHRLFPNARYSIWVDSKSQFRRDPLGVLEALLWRTNSVLAISEHGNRSSVYDEAKAVVKKNKATPEEVEVQLTQYRQDGLPEDKRFNGQKALAEASIIVREHTPETNWFMCLWFNEVVRFTSRDQLSFPYTRWRSKVLKNINMFPACAREDLVNRMGHVQKAKPLITHVQ